MKSSNILGKVRQWSVNGHINFKKHAFTRMVERRIKVTEVEEALQHPEIIKHYPEDKPLGSVLLLGNTDNGRSLHIVAAPDEESNCLWVITVYEPDPDKWDHNLKKRK